MAYTLTCAIDKDRKEQKGDEPNVYRALASTDALDRDGDVMVAEGCITEDFMKNPVMLFIHNYRQVPVAKVLNLEVGKGQVAFSFEFAETDIAKELKYLYDNDFMNAFSVGFYPKSRFQVEDDTPDKFKVEANGTSVEIDLTKYSERPRQLICAWELLEVSPVPVPANPEALLIRAKEDVIRKFVGSVEQKSMVNAILDEQVQDVKGIVDHFLHSIGEFELRGAVPSHSTPIDMETAWNGDSARVALAKWASSDGSGSKEKMNWAKFSKGFGWFDSEAPNNFTSYKVPHHVPKDGTLIGIWRGITAGMAAILGSRGGVDVGGDKQKVYNHFAGHYKDAGKTPPELSREYSEAELKAIEDGTWEPEPVSQEPEVPKTLDIDQLTKQVAEALAERLGELEDTLCIRLSILQELLKEKGKAEPQEPASSKQTEEVTDTLANMNNVLAGVFGGDN